jgi:hypothetical protein
VRDAAVYTEELGITHFLLPMNLNLKCEGIVKIYQNEDYQIFEAAGD